MPALESKAPKKKILFVDDEPLILEGLQRILRPQRKDWEMGFVVSGDAALSALEGNHFDVIVTDMRMPGMDGAQLLTSVKERFPGVIRIVLSGFFEKEAALRAVAVAHRFLAKPCDPKDLRDTIERCCTLSSGLDDDDVRFGAGAIGELPSLPGRCARLIEALENPEVAITEVSRIVEQDVALTAKVLQLVNSAFFGPSQEIINIRAAVSYLGLDILKALVLSAEVLKVFQPQNGVPGFSYEAFQAHSYLTASIASRLPVPQNLVSSTRVAALLHDTGLLVLSTRLPEKFRLALSIAAKEQRPLYRVEQEVNGFTHADVGAYLLGIWGLPQPILDGVRNHHHVCSGASEISGFDTPRAVQIADLLAHEQQAGQEAGLYPSAHDDFDADWLAATGLAPEVPAWRAMASELAEATVF
ncbi:MAG: HDOD domain-containing protein [Acidobacteriia bacterium]|nr:HDOD domain-containing protein [Terriglobia bacterium]